MPQEFIDKYQKAYDQSSSATDKDVDGKQDVEDKKLIAGLIGMCANYLSGWPRKSHAKEVGELKSIIEGENDDNPNFNGIFNKTNELQKKLIKDILVKRNNSLPAKKENGAGLTKVMFAKLEHKKPQEKSLSAVSPGLRTLSASGTAGASDGRIGDKPKDVRQDALGGSQEFQPLLGSQPDMAKTMRIVDALNNLGFDIPDTQFQNRKT